MSIFDIFNRPAPTAQQQPQPQQQPGPGAGSPTPAGPTATPAAGDPAAIRAGKDGGESPLANFADLWKIDPTQTSVDPVAALTPKFNIDPNAVAEAAKQLDYSKLVPQELMTKALGGDTASFAQILNAVTQAATANASINSSKITEAALAHQATQFMKVMPAEMRKLQINSQVVQDNPIFSNPAAAPMMDMLTKQLSVKFPTASASEISEHAASYMTEFVKAMGGAMPTATETAAAATAKAGVQDWDLYFNKQ